MEKDSFIEEIKCPKEEKTMKEGNLASAIEQIEMTQNMEEDFEGLFASMPPVERRHSKIMWPKFDVRMESMAEEDSEIAKSP